MTAARDNRAAGEIAECTISARSAAPAGLAGDAPVSGDTLIKALWCLAIGAQRADGPLELARQEWAGAGEIYLEKHRAAVHDRWLALTRAICVIRATDLDGACIQLQVLGDYFDAHELEDEEAVGRLRRHVLHSILGVLIDRGVSPSLLADDMCHLGPVGDPFEEDAGIYVAKMQQYFAANGVIERRRERGANGGAPPRMAGA